jgi:hypothetical protein
MASGDISYSGFLGILIRAEIFCIAKQNSPISVKSFVMKKKASTTAESKWRHRLFEIIFEAETVGGKENGLINCWSTVFGASLPLEFFVKKKVWSFITLQTFELNFCAVYFAACLTILSPISARVNFI